MSQELQFRVEVKSGQSLSKQLEDYIISEVSKAVDGLVPVVNRFAGQTLEAAIINQPEWASLHAIGVNDLGGEFGLADPGPTLKGLLGFIINSIKTTKVPYQSLTSIAGLNVHLLEDNFANLLKAPDAEYHSITKSGAKLIPWLQWLLFAGGDVIIAGYEINTQRIRKNSRTELAIMIQPKYRAAKGWRLPAKFRNNNEQSNFLSRAVDEASPIISEFLTNQIQSI